MTQALSTNKSLADVVAYLGGLPRYTLSAVQSAWDKSQADGFTHRGIWKSLCKDFDQVGCEPPEFEIFAIWLEAARTAEISRPESYIAQPKSKAPLYSPVQSASSALQDLPPLASTSAVESADVSIEMFATRLFDDTVASLQREARTIAAGIVASRLREIADRYAAMAA